MRFVTILEELLGFTFLAVNDKHVKHRRHTEASMHTDQHTSRGLRTQASAYCHSYIWDT